MRKLVLFAGLCVLGGSLSFGGVSAGSASGFAPAADYAAGDGPVSVAVGDLNGDGNHDLATANLYGHSLSVLLNRGDGTFGPRRGRRAADLRSIVLRDLNRDGKPDVVAVSSDGGTVSVWLNRGDGSFRAKRDYEAPGSVAVGIGDVNGDGALDVVAANRFSKVSVRLNRGNGRLRVARRYRTGLEPVSVALGDLNGDGKLDLVTANSEANTVSVLVNKGNGRFKRRRDHAVGRGPMAVSTADLSGDGRPDIVSANLDSGTVSVLVNAGAGTFTAHDDYPVDGDPRSLAIGDIDGVGGLDIVTANAESTVSVLLGSGSGGFQPARPFATGRHALSVALGDLNMDGGTDLVTANLEDDSVSVLLGSTAVLCTAPDVVGSSLTSATQAIEDAHCRVGTVERAYSDSVAKDSVSAEHPRAGTTLPAGGTIDVVLSDGPAPGAGGLLLWNRLGSQEEVSKSAYGPNLTFFDCGDRSATTAIGGRCSTDVRGKLRYVSGVDGGAATVGGGPYPSEARVHTAVLRESILNPEHGAVEVWYRQRKNPVPFQHDQYRIFGGPYSLTGLDEVMLFSGVQGRGPRLHFWVFFGQEPRPYVPGHVVAARSLADRRLGYPIAKLKGRWAHIAGVWDRQGIAGTSDTVRLYVNGAVVAASRATSWGTTPCGRRVSARPGGACFTDVAGCNDVCARTFEVDDLRLWNYAKTDFSGRLREGP